MQVDRQPCERLERCRNAADDGELVTGTHRALRVSSLSGGC
jgi:hypothetical protein